MSGLGRLPEVQVPQVQVPNYSGIGALIAQSGQGAGGLAQGLQAGMQMGNEQNKMGILQQQANQQGQMDQMKIAEQKQQFMGNMAYGISKIAPDKQEAAYKQVVGGLMQQGIIKPEEAPPQWDKGGKDMVDQLKVQSPMYQNQIKNSLEMMKLQSDLDYKKQSLGISQQNADTAKQSAGLKLGYTLGPDGQAIPIPKALSGRDAVKAAGAQGLQSGLDTLKQLDANDQLPASLGISSMTPNFLRTPQDQQYEAVIANIKAHYKATGGDESEINNLLPKSGDTPDIRQQKYAQLEEHANAISKSIQPYGTPNGAGFVQNRTGIPQAGATPAGYAEAAAAHPGLTQDQYRSLLSGK